MNARVSRVLRRWALLKGYSLKRVKRAWNRTPRPLRGQARLAFRTEIEAHRA